METPGLASGLLGSGSVLDSEAWQEMVQHRPPTGLSRAPSLLETGATCEPSPPIKHCSFSSCLSLA